MKRLIAPALAAALLVPLAGSAQTSVTANAGWSSNYFYRRVPQKSSSTSAGLDVEGANGLSIGVWGADVGEGNEVDFYGGYGLDIGALSLSVGGTGYFYTGAFDDTYLEANFGAAVGLVSLEFSVGQYDTAPASLNYWFLSATFEQNGLYATIGTFGDGFGGEYLEAGYGFTASDLDLTIGRIFSTADLVGRQDQTLVFAVSKTFAID
jgi:uncharacterized protein (TIGR02001 family)